MTSTNVPPAVVPAPGNAPAGSELGLRRRMARWLLGAAASLLAVAAIWNWMSYVTVRIALANSGLEPGVRQALRAHWLGFSLEAIVVAAIVALAAWHPTGVSNAVLLFAGLLTLLQAALLTSFIGSFSGSLLLVFCGALVLLGALLRGGARPAAP